MPGGQQCVPVQFFAGSPRLHNLTALLVLFEKPGDEAPGKQVLRCRELIFRCPAVLASPSDDAEAVLVVVPRAFNLFPTLAEMRARVLGERPAGPDDFACCLRYTLQAKLAPQWNVVGELLLQGRDFLQVTGPVNGVRLQVNVTEEDVCLSAQACVVRLPPLRLSDLGASPVALVDFNARLTDVISESQLTGRWCHILPRMTKGQVATVTRHLPLSGPFAAYKDLKRHWKNMYGYRLPEEEPAHYVNVNFRLVGPQLFTYPPLCLRNGSPVFLARPAPRPILTALLRDLHVKVGSVCGQPLSFSGTPSYLTVQLQPAPTFQPDCRPNVSSEPVGRQPPPAVRRVGQVAETGQAEGGRPGTAAQARVSASTPSTPQQQQHRQQKQPQLPKQQQPRPPQQQQPPEQQQPRQQQQQQQQQQQPGPQKPQQQPRPKQQQLQLPRSGLAPPFSASPASRHPPPPSPAVKAPGPAAATKTPVPAAAKRGGAQPPSPRVATAPSCTPLPRPYPVSRPPTSACVGSSAAARPTAGPTSTPTGVGSRPGLLPCSPRPGQLASPGFIVSNTGDGSRAVGMPSSPHPARIVPLFKPRPVAGARVSLQGKTSGAARQTGASKATPARPTPRAAAATAGAGRGKKQRPAGKEAADSQGRTPAAGRTAGPPATPAAAKRRRQ